MLYVCLGTEPECRRTVGLLNYIRVDDCQSEEQIELTYCEASRCTFIYEGRNNFMKLYTYNLSHLSFSLTHRESVAASPVILWKSTRLRASVCVAPLQAPCRLMFPCAALTAREHTSKSSLSLAVTACHTPVRPTENMHTNMIK